MTNSSVISRSVPRLLPLSVACMCIARLACSDFGCLAAWLANRFASHLETLAALDGAFWPVPQRAVSLIN